MLPAIENASVSAAGWVDDGGVAANVTVAVGDDVFWDADPPQAAIAKTSSAIIRAGPPTLIMLSCLSLLPRLQVYHAQLQAAAIIGGERVDEVGVPPLFDAFAALAEGDRLPGHSVIAQLQP